MPQRLLAASTVVHYSHRATLPRAACLALPPHAIPTNRSYAPCPGTPPLGTSPPRQAGCSRPLTGHSHAKARSCHLLGGRGHDDVPGHAEHRCRASFLRPRPPARPAHWLQHPHPADIALLPSLLRSVSTTLGSHVLPRRAMTSAPTRLTSPRRPRCPFAEAWGRDVDAIFDRRRAIAAMPGHLYSPFLPGLLGSPPRRRP